MQQTEDLRHLHDDFKQLLSQSADGQKELSGLLASEHAKSRDHTSNMIQQSQTSTEMEVKKMLAAAATEAQRQQLLQSFKYEHMNERRNRIEQTHGGTFHWVLRSKQSELESKAASLKKRTIPISADCESDWTSITSSVIGDDCSDHSDDFTSNSKRLERNRPWDSPEFSICSDDIRYVFSVQPVWEPTLNSSWESPLDSSVLDTFDNFAEWLHSDGIMYWIQGKPGSGKSTLVKYVAENFSTVVALALWRPRTKILSHYFWKLGGGEQRTIKGFWCSLAYQILSLSRDRLADDILEEFSHAKLKSATSDWSLHELEMICLAMLRKQNDPVCIFIDGLDEIDEKDGARALKQAVSRILLAIPGGVKFCLASRPEIQFETWLGNLPTLKLHDLTHRDMLQFVEDAMKESQAALKSLSESTVRQIRERLAIKAEGVFLWLTLATNSVIQGLEQHDSEQEIFERIDHMPNEIEGLYSEMWTRMNEGSPIYRKDAARLLNLAVTHTRLNPNHPLPLVGISLATLPEYNQVWDRIVKEGVLEKAELRVYCEKTKHMIKVRSAGLLDVLGPPLTGSVIFIHRTAYDYLMDTTDGQEILSYGSVSDADKVADLVLMQWAYTWAIRATDPPYAHDRVLGISELLFISAEEVGDQEGFCLIQRYFELESRWGWRFPIKEPTLRYPLLWLLGHYHNSLPRVSPVSMMRTKFQVVKVFQGFQTRGLTNTLALRNFLGDAQSRVSQLWHNDLTVALELLQCGADPTVVGPFLRSQPLAGTSFPEGNKPRREASALELMVIQAWEAQNDKEFAREQNWSVHDEQRLIIDMALAAARYKDGLSRKIPMFYDLLSREWWVVPFGFNEDIPAPLARSVWTMKFVFQVNLAQLLHRILYNISQHGDSAMALDKLQTLWSQTLHEPVSLIGVFIQNPHYAAYSTLDNRRHYYRSYRMHNTPLIQCSFAIEELWQLNTIGFRPHVKWHHAWRAMKAKIRHGVRHGVLKRVENLSQLLEQEGLATYS